jgi:hypothetical protein
MSGKLFVFRRDQRVGVAGVARSAGRLQVKADDHSIIVYHSSMSRKWPTPTWPADRARVGHPQLVGHKASADT